MILVIAAGTTFLFCFYVPSTVWFLDMLITLASQQLGDKEIIPILQVR